MRLAKEIFSAAGEVTMEEPHPHVDIILAYYRHYGSYKILFKNEAVTEWAELQEGSIPRWSPHISYKLVLKPITIDKAIDDLVNRIAWLNRSASKDCRNKEIKKELTAFANLIKSNSFKE